MMSSNRSQAWQLHLGFQNERMATFSFNSFILIFDRQVTTLRQLWDLKVMIATAISYSLLSGVQSYSNHQATKIGESERPTLKARVH